MNATREIRVPLEPSLLHQGDSIWLRIQTEEPQPTPVLEPTPRDSIVVARYQIWREGSEWGPYSLQELRRLWSMGTVNEMDYVREESQVEWRLLSELVASVHNHLPCRPECPVRLEIRTEDPDEEAPDYFYPPFSGVSWWTAAAVICCLGAVVLSLAPISQLALAVCALVLGFLLALKNCLTCQSWVGMAVPAIALWLVTLVQLDQNHWTPFAPKIQVSDRSTTPASQDSTLSLIMFPPPEKPMTQAKPLNAVTPRTSEVPVVWVEYSGNP
jgi:hypothetical protein